MKQILNICFGSFIVFQLICIILCHPQCLDYRPPFNSTVILDFCPQYSEFGCCTQESDAGLFEKYYSIKKQISESVWRRCSSHVRQLMCQTCSPYAAHIYDAEATMKPRSFPGLCTSYSSELYDTCRDIIRYISDEGSLLQSLNTKQTFIDYVKLVDVDYCFPELLTNPILTNQISAQQVTSEGCLCLEEFASELKNPLWAQHAGDSSDRLFIMEQIGLLHIYFTTNRTKIPEPFLDITGDVYTTSSRGDERGFLGMAFHPNFKQNNKFYVYYSTRGEEYDEKTRLSEFHLSHNNPNKANRSSERILLDIQQPYWNHNGGEVLFGDDGYLYLFVGDGGSGGDPHGYAQNKSSLLGKILRVDVDKVTPDLPYGIPRDNPFVNEEETYPEIFAYGVRNIWRCGKDRGDRKTGEGKGRIICGDVGQNMWEEVDIVKKGANYGWNAREGFACFDEDLCGEIGPEELPIHSYNHTIGKSVTGGHIYRGCESPNLYGMYIYGDFFNGALFRLKEDKTTGTWENKELFMCGPEICLNGLIGQYHIKILSFGEDEEGEIYLLSTPYESPTKAAGTVYKIVEPARRGNPADCKSANKDITKAPTTSSTTINDSKTPNIGIRIEALNITEFILLLICTMRILI